MEIYHYLSAFCPFRHLYQGIVEGVAPRGICNCRIRATINVCSCYLFPFFSPLSNLLQARFASPTEAQRQSPKFATYKKVSDCFVFVFLCDLEADMANARTQILWKTISVMGFRTQTKLR